MPFDGKADNTIALCRQHIPGLLDNTRIGRIMVTVKAGGEKKRFLDFSMIEALAEYQFHSRF